MTLRQEAIQNLQVALYDYNRKPTYKRATAVALFAHVLWAMHCRSRHAVNKLAKEKAQ